MSLSDKFPNGPLLDRNKYGEMPDDDMISPEMDLFGKCESVEYVTERNIIEMKDALKVYAVTEAQYADYLKSDMRRDMQNLKDFGYDPAMTLAQEMLSRCQSVERNMADGFFKPEKVLSMYRVTQEQYDGYLAGKTPKPGKPAAPKP